MKESESGWIRLVLLSGFESCFTELLVTKVT